MHNRTEQEIMHNWKGNIDDIVVSVCSVTYNHEKYISEALDSFLMQETNFPFEIIVRDDCSTDKTTEIIRKYEERYPKIVKPIYEKVNGYSKGIRPLPVVLKKANARYCALCDGDDFWTDSNKLQKQVNFLDKNKEYVMCFHDGIKVNLSGSLLTKTSGFNLKDFSSDDMICAEAPMFTGSIVFRNIDLKQPEDFKDIYYGSLANIHLLGFHGKAKYMNDIEGSAYRVHKGGVSSKLNDTKRLIYGTKTRLKLKKNIQNRDDLVQRLEKVINTKILETLFVALRERDTDTYKKIIKYVKDEKEIKTVPFLAKHGVDIVQRVGSKVLKKVTGRS